MPFIENGIGVDLPSHFPAFRLSDIPAYVRIKNQGVKEMDIGWLDTAHNTLFLVELKAYFHPENPHHQPTYLNPPQSADFVTTLCQELVEKAIHSLSFIYGGRQDSQNHIPQLPQDHRLKIAYLIRVPNGQSMELMALGDEIRKRLRPYIHLFNITDVMMIDWEIMKGEISWVV